MVFTMIFFYWIHGISPVDLSSFLLEFFRRFLLKFPGVPFGIGIPVRISEGLPSGISLAVTLRFL